MSSTDNFNTFDLNKHGERFLTGSAIGITGMLLSSLSSELTGHKLGYSNIGLKNGFNITLSSGLMTCLVMKVAEQVK